MKRSLGVVAVLAALSGCVTIPDTARSGQQTAQASTGPGVARAAAPDGPTPPLRRYAGGVPADLVGGPPSPPADALPSMPAAAPLPGLPTRPRPESVATVPAMPMGGMTALRPPTLPPAPPLP